MSWKSYAAVSGATVLAGWLASTPPASELQGTAVVSRQPQARVDAAASTIAHEADRLRVRVRREVDYAQPQRNPFRFGAGRAEVDRGGDIPAAATVTATSEPAAPIPFNPPPPPVTLAGIAEDEKGGGQMERTAILSSPSGVLLVREGDVVIGDYRVGRIESEAVELVKTDGSILRLTLRN